MLQDAVRTGTYHKAFISNPADFRGKVVVDVGTGSGILAFFAAKAGARKVYAIEASGVASQARKLMEANGLADKVEVIKGKVEEVELPEKADVIISEPMGFLLVHERMLESFIAARDRFLKPAGKMFPTTGTMFFSPFSDQAIWDEQDQKLAFWDTQDFWGLDLSPLKQQARIDHFSQPVVGYFAPSVLLSPTTARHCIDFASDKAESLKSFTVPLAFTVVRTAILHGIAAWFDVLFDGTAHKVSLSTGPYTAGTHWYQCRLLMEDPIAVNAGQAVSGMLEFQANDKYSYDIKLTLRLEGTSIEKVAQFSLADQYFAYYSGTDAGAAAATPAVESAWASGDPYAGTS